MWISVGIDLDANYTIQAAAEYTADGGYALTSSMSSGGGSSGPSGNSTMGNGTAPSGSPPSGNGGANMTMTAVGNGTAPSGSAPSGANMTMGEVSPVGGNGTTSTGSSSSTTSVAIYTGSSEQVARPALTILAAFMLVVMSL